MSVDDNWGEILRKSALELNSGDNTEYTLRSHISNFSLDSSENTTTTPLTNGQTFTGTGEKNNYSHFGISLKTDQGGILYTDFSNDGVNWDSTFPPIGFVITAGVHEFHTGVKMGRYFRVRFVNNSGSDQTYLRLYTYYGNNFVPSNAPFNQALGLDSDSISVRPTSFSDEVVIGRRTGITHYTKFGYRSALLAASGEQTIWANGATNFTPMTTASAFTITYNNTTDGLGTTGALSLLFDYINDDGLRATATHVLSNTGSDVTAFSGLGINRCVVLSSGSSTFNNNTIDITETTGATPQAYIPAGDSVTQQAIYFVDSNSDAVGKFLYIQTNKLTGGGTPRVLIKGKVFNRTTLTTYLVYRGSIDTSVESNVTISDPVGFKLSPRDVLYFTADTDTNGTEVDIRFSFVEYKRN